MVWAQSKGITYLRRSYYEGRQGTRRHTSLGPRSAATEKQKADFEQGRREARARFKELREALDRQASINRAIGLGRIPLIAARILRALDDVDLLGNGLRVIGTNAIRAYEAAAGVFVDAEIAATEDLDLLIDARAEVRFVATGDFPARNLMNVLRRVDHSFVKERQNFRASNRDGYLVDLVEPLRHPPRQRQAATIGTDRDDLDAVEIEGLVWLENAPSFEAVVIDDRGAPARMVVPDPRVFAAHKLWLSKRPDRDPLQRRRDAAQAQAVASLVALHLPHLPYVASELKLLPLETYNDARSLFAV